MLTFRITFFRVWKDLIEIKIFKSRLLLKISANYHLYLSKVWRRRHCEGLHETLSMLTNKMKHPLPNAEVKAELVMDVLYSALRNFVCCWMPYSNILQVYSNLCYLKPVPSELLEAMAPGVSDLMDHRASSYVSTLYVNLKVEKYS